MSSRENYSISNQFIIWIQLNQKRKKKIKRNHFLSIWKESWDFDFHALLNSVKSVVWAIFSELVEKGM